MTRSSLCLNCAQIHDCPLDHGKPCVHDRRNTAPVNAETVESLLAEREVLRAELVSEREQKYKWFNEAERLNNELAKARAGKDGANGKDS